MLTLKIVVPFSKLGVNGVKSFGVNLYFLQKLQQQEHYNDQF